MYNHPSLQGQYPPVITDDERSEKCVPLSKNQQWIRDRIRLTLPIQQPTYPTEDLQCPNKTS